MEEVIDSREVGLEVGLNVFKFFLKSEYLHYGYFEGLEIDVANLRQAQENYAKMLFAHIPAGTKSILDVGCGSGKTAAQLLSMGYEVDCVSPGTILTKYARNLVGPKTHIYRSKWEETELQRKYDLILFSESFQYIPMQIALQKAIAALNPGGHIMICDFFQTDAPGESKLGGGHKYSEWKTIYPAMPLRLIHERDITEHTAPTLDLVHQMTQEVIRPLWTSGFALAEQRFPLLLKFVRWYYKEKLEKMERKHFSGERTGATFKTYKKYMFYLFQAQNA